LYWTVTRDPITVNPPICERTVTFQENKVVDQNWTGDPGYCRYFKRA